MSFRLYSCVAPGLILAVVAMPVAVWGKGADSHLCDPHAAAPLEPAIAMPPAGSVPPSGTARGTEGDDRADQVLGCLPRTYRLDAVRKAAALSAVRMHDEPGSMGVIFAYRSVGDRNALIDNFARHWFDVSVSGQMEGFYLAEWRHASARLPDGSILSAVYEEEASSGKMCVVRANVAVLRQSRPVLGNWCMDRLGLWSGD